MMQDVMRLELVKLLLVSDRQFQLSDGDFNLRVGHHETGQDTPTVPKVEHPSLDKSVTERILEAPVPVQPTSIVTPLKTPPASKKRAAPVELSPEELLERQYERELP